jgi:hypothetical protein
LCIAFLRRIRSRVERGAGGHPVHKWPGRVERCTGAHVPKADFVGAALSTGDYDNDSFADLAIGAPFEDIGTILDAGAINVLYGSASTLTTTGGQQFFQGSGGVAGSREEGDTFGSSLA